MSKPVAEMNDVELKAHIIEIATKYESEQKNLEALELAQSKKMPDIVSASMRDLNKIIWPNTFSSGYLMISPTVAFAEKNLPITAEAAFVATKMVRSVFKMVNGVPVWINPEDINLQVNGLKVQTSDPQSTRSFNQKPISIDNIGYGRFPTEMLSRPLILPNSAINIKLYSNNNVDTYYANISFIGYRIRIEDAEQLLGLVTRY